MICCMACMHCQAQTPFTSLSLSSPCNCTGALKLRSFNYHICASTIIFSAALLVKHFLIFFPPFLSKSIIFKRCSKSWGGNSKETLCCCSKPPFITPVVLFHCSFLSSSKGLFLNKIATSSDRLSVKENQCVFKINSKDTLCFCGRFYLALNQPEGFIST